MPKDSRRTGSSTLLRPGQRCCVLSADPMAMGVDRALCEIVLNAGNWTWTWPSPKSVGAIFNVTIATSIKPSTVTNRLR